MKKEMKILSVFLISVMFLSLVAGIVAAQSASDKFGESITGIVDGIQKGGNPIFKALFGTDAGATGAELFVEILAFLLVIFVVYGILNQVGIFGDKYWINLVLGIIVAVLGIRFLPDGILTQAAFPSSAFVALLVMGLPFILLFFLIQNLPKLVRRAIWTVYGVLIIFLWVYNWDKPFSWLYPVIVLACAAAFAFDGVLGRFLRKAKSERIVGKSKDSQEHILRGDIMRLTASLAHTTDPKMIIDLKAQIKEKKAGLKIIQGM